MGRVPTKNMKLPKGMRARVRPSGTHYYFDTGDKPRREIPLGKDYVAAVQEWAKLTQNVTSSEFITFRSVADQYTRDVIPKKGIATQRKNLHEKANLLDFFGESNLSLESIEPQHIRQYMDWRCKVTLAAKIAQNERRADAKKPPLEITGTEGQVQANRDKALFSHIWNYARERGITAMANPCAGIKGFKELGRDNYISEEAYLAVWEAGTDGLRDAMDLAYLSAQRKADLLKMSRGDIKDAELNLRQNKTGKRLRISIEGYLAEVIARINSRKVAGIALICNKHGQRITESELRGAFEKARKLAAESTPSLSEEIRNFQFRDLRAKAATDKEESAGMDAAQAQLGHSTPAMTAHYVRHRRGKLVKPTR